MSQTCISYMRLSVVTRLLVSMCAVGLCASAVAQAPNGTGGSGGSDGGPSQKKMKEEAKDLAQRNGVAGSDTAFVHELSSPVLNYDGVETVVKKANGEGGSEGGSQEQPDTFGSNQLIEADIAFPVLKENRRVMDGKAYRELVRDLITTELSTVFITMQMVENGAAQGFANATNFSQNMVQNTLASVTAKFGSLDSTDKNYAERVKGMNSDWAKASKDKGWMAGWMEVQGDRAAAQGERGKVEAPNEIEPKLYAYGAINKSVTGGAGTGAGSNNSNGGQNRVLLSNLLFSKQDRDGQAGGAGGGGSNETRFTNRELDQLKTEFTELVGDIEREYKASSGGTASSGANGESDVRDHITKIHKPTKGPASVMTENLKTAWESWFTLLEAMCTFKKTQAGNKNAHEYEMDSLASDTGFRDKAKEHWPKITAPGIFVSTNLLEQAYTLFRNQRVDKDLDCTELSARDNKMPEGEQANDITTENLNDCKGKKSCLRNKLFFHIVQLIAAGRTLRTYDQLYMNSVRFVTDRGQLEQLNELFESTFEGKGLGEQISETQERYRKTINYMGQLMQGFTSGSILRPNDGQNVAGGLGANAGEGAQVGGN